ncbi:MAG TPA: cold shock domain-containing protein [Alphaproteobacteria bacterium]|nr:cold shock domain-containing protein [Alphaproteobacteria bacterium]
MRQGKVKWYNGKKCFGFITPDSANETGNKEDVFVHSSSLKAADIRFLNENDIVEFEEEVRNGKLSVTTLKLIKRDEESAKKFQERRSEFHGNRGDRNNDRGDRREDRGERRGFAFWKK